MKIKTKTITEPKDCDECSYLRYKKGDVREITFGAIEDFCCDEMRKATEKRFIVFGEDDWLNKDNHMNIIRTACYPSGTVVDRMGISFCPFCGEEIEVENIETMVAK